MMKILLLLSIPGISTRADLLEFYQFIMLLLYMPSLWSFWDIKSIQLTIMVQVLVEVLWHCFSNKLYWWHILGMGQIRHHGLFQLFSSFTGFIQGKPNKYSRWFVTYDDWKLDSTWFNSRLSNLDAI